MGADVIKIEKWPNGDDTRHSVPPKIGDEAASFLMMNRNKRGLALDLKSEQGRALLLRMVKQADVLVENFRGGTMDKLGLGYEVLKAHNPGLIYCAITGYGRSGPYADKGGFDLIAQGFAGLMSVTGEPGRGPMRVGVANSTAVFVMLTKTSRSRTGPAASPAKASRWPSTTSSGPRRRTGCWSSPPS